MPPTTRFILSDPSSVYYFEIKLVDISNSTLNRDSTLLPFHRLHVVLPASQAAEILVCKTPFTTHMSEISQNLFRDLETGRPSSTVKRVSH